MGKDRILIPVSPGELVDKLTILEIKSARIDDRAKLRNVEVERAALETVAETALPASAAIDALRKDLRAINERLWAIEDEIREEEAAGRFGDRFVELARSVYRENDRRAALKRRINIELGSEIIEEKSYKGD